MSPLALVGRQILVREGCVVCHAVAPPDARATDPDEHVPVRGPQRAPSLAGVGGKYPHLWHVWHLRDPRTVSPGSTMPSYAFLETPAPRAGSLAEEEARAIATGVAEAGGSVDAGSELVAVIAYLQQLEPPPAPATPPPPDLDALDAALRAEGDARAAEGAALFAQYCVACHGDRGEGHVGPPLGDAAWLHGSRPAQVLRSIALGHPQKGMPGWAPVVGEDAVRSLAVHVLWGLAAP